MCDSLQIFRTIYYNKIYYRMLIYMIEKIMPKALLTFNIESTFNFLLVLSTWSIFLNFYIGKAYNYNFFIYRKLYSSIICSLFNPRNIINSCMTIFIDGFLSYIKKYFNYCNYFYYKVDSIFVCCDFIVLHLYHKKESYCWFTKDEIFGCFEAITNAGFDASVLLLLPYT